MHLYSIKIGGNRKEIYNDIFFFLVLVTVILLLQCNNTSSPMPGQITLGSYPTGAGTIYMDPDVPDYTIGDEFTFTAVPYSDKEFFKWGGTIESYEQSFTYIIDTKDQTFIAYFPFWINNDSSVFLGELAEDTVEKGEYALFNFALDLPMNETYTLFCTCDEYDNFSFSMGCEGDAREIMAGCSNAEPTVQTQWKVMVKSNSTDSVYADFNFTYNVVWK